MLAAEHVLSYVHGTWNQMIHYSRDSRKNPNVLWDCVNSDWAGDTEKRGRGKRKKIRKTQAQSNSMQTPFPPPFFWFQHSLKKEK